MESLTQSRLDTIDVIRKQDIIATKSGLSFLSYNDLIFLKIIQNLGLRYYTSRIQTQLNIIRESYIRYLQGKTQPSVRQVNQYDITDPFRIAVICSNREDFKTEIVDRSIKSFPYNMTRGMNSIRVAEFFEFRSITREESLCSWRFDGTTETSRATQNPKYGTIQSMLPNSLSS